LNRHPTAEARLPKKNRDELLEELEIVGRDKIDWFSRNDWPKI